MEDRQSSIETPQPPEPSSSPRSLLSLGVAWTRVGYGVLALATAAFVLNLAVRPAMPPVSVKPMKPGSSTPAKMVVLQTAKGPVAVPPGFKVEVDGEDVLAYPEDYRLMGGRGGGIALRPTPLAAVSIFLIVFSALAGFVWTFVDVIDRRRRFVWLLPMFVCPVVAVLHALPLALYLFYGRETPDAPEDVQ